MFTLNEALKIAGLSQKIDEAKAEIDPDYLTAKQGARDAKKDVKGGYVDEYKPGSGEKAMRQHLKVTIGPSKEYCDAYIDTLNTLFAKK